MILGISNCEPFLNSHAQMLGVERETWPSGKDVVSDGFLHMVILVSFSE